jgi:hypothetical protein
MKKIKFILLLAIVTIIPFLGFSQPNLCDDPCPPGNKLWHTQELCNVSYQPVGSPPTDPPIKVITVFVEIAYRVRTCNGVTSYIIEDYVFVDARNYLVTLDPNLATQINISTSCPYPNPPTASSINAAIDEAISKFLEGVGNPAVGNYDIYFKGSCNSLAILNFPDGTFFTSSPNDLGRVDTFYLNSASTITQSIPCNDACCKRSYNWQMVTLKNGETISKWMPVSAEGGEENCENSVAPEYSTYPNKITGKKFDQNGRLIDVTASSYIQGPCELVCPRVLIPPPPDFTSSIKSDLVKSGNELLLNASPLPFSNFLQLNSNREISKIVLYDIQGNEVLKTNRLENGLLNTTDLKNGMYFIQVYFPNNIVKTIRVLKQ